MVLCFIGAFRPNNLIILGVQIPSEMPETFVCKCDVLDTIWWKLLLREPVIPSFFLEGARALCIWVKWTELSYQFMWQSHGLPYHYYVRCHPTKIVLNQQEGRLPMEHWGCSQARTLRSLWQLGYNATLVQCRNAIVAGFLAITVGYGWTEFKLHTMVFIALRITPCDLMVLFTLLVDIMPWGSPVHQAPRAVTWDGSYSWNSGIGHPCLFFFSFGECYLQRHLDIPFTLSVEEIPL